MLLTEEYTVIRYRAFHAEDVILFFWIKLAKTTFVLHSSV
jgi:hypothetical protein